MVGKTLDRIHQEHENAKSTRIKEGKDAKDLEELIGHIIEAQQIVQEAAKQVQQKAHEQIASIVSRCLETVFSEPYEFKIHFEQKRGKTEARLAFVRDGLEVDPITGAGGGVVDVASFALRLACLLLAQPPKRKFLCLDEPFRFLSKEFQPRVRGLLESLSKDLGIQILFTTHNTELQVGKIIRLKEETD